MSRLLSRVRTSWLALAFACAFVAPRQRSLEAQANAEDSLRTLNRIESAIRRSQLPSGLRLALVPLRKFPNEVEARIFVRFGSPEAVAGRATEAQQLGRLLEHGTATISRDSLTRAFEQLGSRVRFLGHANALRISVTANRAGLVPTLELIAAVMRAPAYPDAAVEAWQATERSRWHGARTNVASLGGVYSDRRLMPWPEEHPYARLTAEAESLAVERVSGERLRALHAQLVGGSHGDIAVVGDFDADAVTTWARRALGDWRSPVPAVRYVRRNFNVPASHEDIPVPGVPPNAVLAFGHQIALRSIDPDHPALEIANFSIAGDFRPNRFDSRLRTRRRLVVGQSSRFAAEPRDSAAVFEFSALVPRDSVVAAERAALDEFASLQRDGLTAEEFAAGRREWLKLSSNQFSAYDQLAHYLTLEGRELASIAETQRLVRHVESLTLEQVNAALRRHFDPSKFVIVRVGAPPGSAVPRMASLNPAAPAAAPAASTGSKDRSDTPRAAPAPAPAPAPSSDKSRAPVRRP